MKKHSILIIDDDLYVINSIIRFLGYSNYKFYYTTKPEEAFELIKSLKLDVIITDQKMPNISGLEILKYAKKVTPITSRILITGYSQTEVVISAINDGNIYKYIAKPWEANEFEVIIKDAIEYKIEQETKEKTVYQLIQENQNYIKDIKESDKRIVNSLLKIIEAKDIEIYDHCIQVSNLSLLIAEKLNLSEEDKLALRYASLFHDIGKISIRDEVLYKPGKLIDIEFDEIKNHSKVGSEIIEELNFMDKAAKIVCQHHEKINGEGYPDGLKGDEILLEAKIVSVADCYDALVSHRVYRGALDQDKAIEILKDEINISYDETIVNTCISILNDERLKNISNS